MTPPPGSFQYRQLCNFVQHHSKQKGKKKKRTWATSFGESLAGRDFEDFAVVADEDVDAADGDAGEGGVHPQQVDGLDAADGTAAVQQLKAESQLTRLPPPLWPLATTTEKAAATSTKKTTLFPGIIFHFCCPYVLVRYGMIL